MKKFVVISVNENIEYLFYIPLVTWAWNKLGWKVILIRTCATSHLLNLATHTWQPEFETIVISNKYPSSMIAQISRLYAAIGKNHDDYIMTSDVDMLPLSDYWKFDPEKITIFGHDLTDYNHMPICYVAMKVSRWIDVMGITSSDYNEMINRDISSTPNSKGDNPEKLWCLDQDIITDRINAVQFEKEFVHRGVYQNGYPVGRVDRSAWTLEHDQFIDCHLPRGIWKDIYRKGELSMIMDLLKKVWPNEDFSWFHKYVVDFNTYFYNNLYNG